MRFLLVIPRFAVNLGSGYDLPIGLGYVAASLKAAGHDVASLNLNHHRAPVEELVVQAVERHAPAALFTGGLTPHYPRVKRILDAARKASPGIVNVIGGGLVTAEPELMLTHLDADVGVLGEGETTAAELAGVLRTGGPLSEVKGIAYKMDGGVRLTPPREPIANIDAIPFPDYDALELDVFLGLQAQNDGSYFGFEERPRMVPLVASRSCPYQCTFCFHPLGRKYRQRSVDSILSEVEFLIARHDVNYLMIQDELFSTRTHKERLVEFCERIRPYGVKWATSLRVDSVDKNLLDLCKRSGCVYISYGIESASDRILRSLKKKITVADIEHALEATYQAGLCFVGNLIFGDRLETPETIRESVDWWLAHKKYLLRVSHISPYPGSALYAYALEAGIIPSKQWLISQYHAMRVNVTSMKDDEFFALADKWASYSYENVYIAALDVHVERAGRDELKGALWKLRIRCPHCGRTVTWGRMNHSWYNNFIAYQLLYCRECGQKSSALPFNVAARIQEVLEGLGDRPFALWLGRGFLHFTHKLEKTLVGRASAVAWDRPPGASPAFLAGEGHAAMAGPDELLALGVSDIVFPVEERLLEERAVMRSLEERGFAVHEVLNLRDLTVARRTLESLIQVGMREQARSVLPYLLEQFPVNPELECIAAGLAPDAQRESAMRGVLERWPECETAYLNLAGLLEEQDRRQEATEAANLGARRMPGSPLLAELASRLKAAAS